MCACHSTYVEIRGQLSGAISLPLPDYGSISLLFLLCGVGQSSWPSELEGNPPASAYHFTSGELRLKTYATTLSVSNLVFRDQIRSLGTKPPLNFQDEKN